MSVHRNVSRAADEAPETSTRKRAREAPCWDHFDKIGSKMGKAKVRGREVVVEIVTAKCKHCLKEFKHTSSKGTTHLNNHVKSCPGVKAAREKTDTLRNGSVNDTDRHDILLAKAMVHHGYRYDMVSDSLFQRYVQSLRPGYQLPSVDRMVELLDRIYSDEVEKLSQVFKGLSSRLSLSISIQESYVYVTAYFIDESWNLQQKILKLKSHDSIDSAVSVEEFIEESSLLNIFTINDKAADLLFFTWPYETITCLDYHLCKDFYSDEIAMINLDDDDYYEATLMDDVKPIPLDECLFGNSTEYKFHIKCAIQVIDVAAKEGTSLYRDVYKNTPPHIRWKDALVSNNHIQLNEEEKNQMRVLRECWGYFYDVYVLLNESDCISSSIFFVKLCEMQSFLESQSNHPDEKIKATVRKMKSKLDTYWGSHKILLSVMCFLDPRYKMTVIKKYYDCIFQNDREYTKINVVINNLMNIYAPAEGLNDSLSDKWISERDLYLSEECLKSTADEVNSKIGILKWWKHEERFKILKRMAKDILGIPLVVSTAKESLIDDFMQQEEYRVQVYSPFEYFSSERALCLYIWLKDENEDTERAENTSREDP